MSIFCPLFANSNEKNFNYIFKPKKYSGVRQFLTKTEENKENRKMINEH
jgi:hypothetical protein